MKKSNLIVVGVFFAAVLFEQQAFADVLLSTARLQFQGIASSSETTLRLDPNASTGLSFSTTASSTTLAIEMSATCRISNAASYDYVDMDILIDGVAMGITAYDTEFCSTTDLPSAGSYLGQNVSAALSTSATVGAGTHTLAVRARIIGSGPYFSQAGISALHINIIR